MCPNKVRNLPVCPQQVQIKRSYIACFMACQSLREPKMTQELRVTSLKGMEKPRTLNSNENIHKNKRLAILLVLAIKTLSGTLNGPRERTNFISAPNHSVLANLLNHVTSSSTKTHFPTLLNDDSAAHCPD